MQKEKDEVVYLHILYRTQGINMLYLESAKEASFQGFPRVYLLSDQDDMQ